MLPEKRISFPSQAQGFACRVAAQFNLAAPVDAPTRVCLRSVRLGRRATEQRR
jgi:hypothetical protein